MSSERSTNPADIVIRLAGEQSRLSVPVLPQPFESKGQQRQRTPLPFDLAKHFLHQLVVLEAIAALGGRLDDSSS